MRKGEGKAVKMPVDAPVVTEETPLPHLPTATGVRFRRGRVVFVLSNGGELSFPLDRFPRLENASPTQRAAWRLRWDGAAIRWDDIDEDISMRVLLTGSC